jgi:hypothetical protein
MILSCNENWNGNLLADCFPVLRPENEGLAADLEVQVHYKGKYAGTAVIKSARIIKWKDINDHVAHLVIAKPAFELKSVMRSFYGFGKIDPHPEFPVFYGIAQWVERDVAVTALMFNEEWKKVKAKAIEEPIDSMNQECLWNVEEGA